MSFRAVIGLLFLFVFTFSLVLFSGPPVRADIDCCEIQCSVGCFNGWGHRCDNNSPCVFHGCEPPGGPFRPCEQPCQCL